MTVKSVQQIMLGTVTKNEKQALETLRAIKAAGFDGIELNVFMIRPTKAGVSAISLMKRLDNRMKLYHINDRGTKARGTSITPILKSDSMELGTGNMNLPELIEQALSVSVSAIVLESHKN